MTELNSINSHKELIVETSFLGTTDYSKSLAIQENLMGLASHGKVGYIIGLEHPAVVTLGYRAEIEKEITNHNEIPIERINRGGLATIHSEGQLVIYPILNLRELGIGAREYVMLLLETTKELLQELGIESYIDEKCIGLYTHTGKIAFCGIQIKNGISQHGLSLNVRNDLSLFSNIRSCGQARPKLDSLSQHKINHTLSDLYHAWIKIFKSKLN